MSPLEINRRNSFERNSLPGQNILVHSDLGLRHTMAAELLDIPLDTYASQQWYRQTDATLVSLLQNNFDLPITLIDGQGTKAAITNKLRNFRTIAAEKRAKSFVISMDSVYGDSALADYVFQETRVSLVHPDQPTIDLEHNKRGYTNRFGRYGPDNNGAGKPAWYQLEQIDTLLNDTTREKIHIAFVEDYINTGISLVARFASLLQQQHIQPTFIPGVISRKAYEAYNLQSFVVDPVWKLEKEPKKYIDLTDLIPTLGGRGIGWSREQEDGTFTSPVLRTVGGVNRMVPLGVDAIVGNYPWQVDLYTADAKPDFMQQIKSFSFSTALQFWKSLEESGGKKIAWEDLRALNGNVKVFYPVKDFDQSKISLKRIGHGPREVIESLIANNQ